MVLDLGAVAELAEEDDAQEGGGDRSRHQPPRQSAVDGSVPEVDGTADRFHDERGHEVGRDRRQGLDLEQEDEDRRHQRPAAHAGQADGEADDQAGDRYVAIDVEHAAASRAGALQPILGYLEDYVR